MDKIQKVLIKAGRKDLAQEYYKKVAALPKVEDKQFDWRESNEAKAWAKKRLSQNRDVYSFAYGGDSYVLFSILRGSSTKPVEDQVRAFFYDDPKIVGKSKKVKLEKITNPEIQL